MSAPVRADRPGTCQTCQGSFGVGDFITFVSVGAGWRPVHSPKCPSSPASPPPPVRPYNPAPVPPPSQSARSESESPVKAGVESSGAAQAPAEARADTPRPPGPGSWTLEFTSGKLLVRRAFLRNEPPTEGELDEFFKLVAELTPEGKP